MKCIDATPDQFEGVTFDKLPIYSVFLVTFTQKPVSLFMKISESTFVPLHATEEESGAIFSETWKCSPVKIEEFIVNVESTSRIQAKYLAHGVVIRKDCGCIGFITRNHRRKLGAVKGIVIHACQYDFRSVINIIGGEKVQVVSIETIKYKKL